MSKELASDLIRHIRHAGEGIWEQKEEGMENLAVTLMSGKARFEKITEKQPRNYPELY